MSSFSRRSFLPTTQHCGMCSSVVLTGILKVAKLPVQSTFWRLVNALHRNVARQMLTVMRTMRERVWAAANVKLAVVTIDTDTTVHTLYGQQMGGRKSYNPKNKGKKSYTAAHN